MLIFSQKVGLTSIIEVMSRAVTTTGAIYLIICSFVPKVGAIIAAMPISGLLPATFLAVVLNLILPQEDKV